MKKNKEEYFLGRTVYKLGSSEFYLVVDGDLAYRKTVGYRMVSFFNVSVKTYYDKHRDIDDVRFILKHLRGQKFYAYGYHLDIEFDHKNSRHLFSVREDNRCAVVPFVSHSRMEELIIGLQFDDVFKHAFRVFKSGLSSKLLFLNPIKEARTYEFDIEVKEYDGTYF